MTRHDFDALVRRTEARYAGRQAALERSTAAWVALGLAGIVAWLALLFLLGVGAFALGVVLEAPGGVILLAVGVPLIVYGVSQAGLFLLTEVSPPEGRVLKPGEAPALGGLLDSLRRELGCRPFDEVRISLDFNAGVREFPRLGVFGWPRTVLEVGLPLAAVLAPEELRAVLAHEFVHLSARHGRGGNRLYRLHRTWGNLIEQMQRPVAGTSGRAVRWAASRFVDWYWPRLHARALVLSRMQEFQADRVAAGLSGGATLASALWRMECLWPWLSERFWADLYRQAEQSPEPPPDVLARLRAALESPPAPEDAARWTERGLSRATDVNDTHPAFPARVRALGLPPDGLRAAGFPAAPRPSAAEAFLGSDLDPIEQELASDWRRKNLAAWRERHRREAADRRRGAPEPPGSPETVVRPPSPAPRDTAALWEAARDATDLRGAAPALPLLRAVLSQDPGHAGAGVVLGHHLLSVGDPEGERLLLGVVDRADEQWMSRACDALQDHYRATGQTDRLHAIRGRLDRHESEASSARSERATIRPQDTFLPHGLTDDSLSALRALLTFQPDCAAAWLVRKDLRYFPWRPLFVLCVVGKPSGWGLDRYEHDRALVNRLIPLVQLPGQVLVLARYGPSRKLAKVVVSRPGAEVYRADCR